MAHLTPKENFLRVLRGDIPEWVPSFSYYGALPGVDDDPPNMSFGSNLFMGDMSTGKDLWGVPVESVNAVGGFCLPKPGAFILKDIRNWRDVIKAPDLSNIDWERVAKDGLDKLPYDRKNVAMGMSGGGGYFLHLMGFMGFTEGLLSYYEEPDAVKELYAYMHEYYMTVQTNLFDYVQPDFLSLSDDVAAERAPFISEEMYREFLLPLYDDLARLARNRGVPINMHNCGASAVFFDDLVRIGVNSWEPVQLVNDIHAIQAKFGRHLVIGGGWEGRGRLIEADVTDEEIRQSVRDAFDAYAPNGGYMLAAAYTPGSLDDKRTAHWNAVLQNEAYVYGHTFYK
ncbi:MAG: veratrol--corrinoid protein metyltransferase [Oscillospiraceae bacterium]|jgi:hypothetical protein|nr:veratrol--corrinoid protein metyltransferase [Oscillospiraceae bacterium]